MLISFVFGTWAQAQTFTTLYNFTGSDGRNPEAGVIQDPDGNLYSTTFYGGDLNCGSGYGCGVVFEVNTAGSETVLHSFSRSDGGFPDTPVVRDKAGNIYGTTAFGGASGNGTVFKIDTAGNEAVLYNFVGGSDGCNPYQGLVMDKAGNLYGTTAKCGSSNWGTIFKVDPAGNFVLRHSFAGYPSDGAYSLYGHLTIDKSGNLYGLTELGGSNLCWGYGCGVLYKLDKNGAFTVLYNFAGGASDGCAPLGSVVRDKAGNFYGTTWTCGTIGYGNIWKVSKAGKETILHNFTGTSSDGCSPFAGVTRDSKGNLYGVTPYCGANGAGALYELRACGKLTLLHSFGYFLDGGYPWGEVLRTCKGKLFGTTSSGGSHDQGTVWKYVPKTFAVSEH